MFAKLMDDSLVTWARDYKIDAFRFFDLMGHHPKDQMVQALAEVKKVKSDMYFYGEGWNFGEVVMTSASCRRPRNTWPVPASDPSPTGCVDAVRGGSPFDGGETIPARPRALATAPLVDAQRAGRRRSRHCPASVRSSASAWPATISRSSC